MRQLHSVHQIDYLPPIVRKFLAAGPRDRDECWEWTGSRDRDGYGQVMYRSAGREVRTSAHRLAYIALAGDIEPGLTLDHLCRNRACVNPRHLEPVSHAVNLGRGDTVATRNRAKTTCPKGHPLVEGNLRSWDQRRGRRGCQTCMLERSAAQTAAVLGARTVLGLTQREYATRYGWSIAAAQRIIAEHQA